MHVLTFVLIPTSVEDVVAEVLERLEPSDASREFPVYKRACPCVGEAAQSAGFQLFAATQRGLVVADLLQRARNSRDFDAEARLLQERLDACLAAARTRPDFGAVDPSCDICGGSGANAFSRNPATHVDWWAIGGRWDRLIQKADDGGHGAVAIEADNILSVAEFDETMFPSAIVTRDGLWYEAPPTFGLAGHPQSDEDRSEAEAWRSDVRALLKDHSQDTIVVVDCHV